MNHHPRGATLPDLPARLEALTQEAWAFAAPDKVEALARQFLSGMPWIVHDGHWETARELAREIVSITPSMLGSTAFDRLARAMKGRSAEDMAALALLRRSQPRFGRLRNGGFEDLASREVIPLARAPLSDQSEGDAVIGRFAALPDGRLMAVGLLVPLDPAAEEVARGFVRANGRGLSNAVRCAEAVYRHMVRRGMATAGPKEPELPFRPDHNPLDALAAEWAALGREPGPEDMVKAARFVGAEPLVNALISVAIAQDGGAKALAEAYRRIAAAVIEFMTLREVHGSDRFSLDHAAGAVDAAVRAGRCGHGTKALFNELRARAKMASGRGSNGSAKASGTELDKLMQRIQALRAKTVEQGCTEQEALTAAEKVAELLDRYGLSLSELDLREQSCEGFGVETGRKRRGPIDDCMGTIALFFDCRVWGETAMDGTIRYIFFGLPGDVQASVYLHDLIVLAFASETAAFQMGEFYGGLVSGERRSATNSFQVGLAHGIIGKLNKLRADRDTAAAGSNGRALVPVKESIIDQELERLGLSLRRVKRSGRKVIPDAFSAGKEAGEKFDYRQGIEGG